MNTNDFVKAVRNVGSFAKEIRTNDLKKDAVTEMVNLMNKGLFGHIALLEGQAIRDELARFFTFKNEGDNAFMAEVVEDACIIYSHTTDKNVRRIIIGALLKSNHRNMSGVQDAVDFFCGDLNIFRRKLAA